MYRSLVNKYGGMPWSKRTNSIWKICWILSLPGMISFIFFPGFEVSKDFDNFSIVTSTILTILGAIFFIKDIFAHEKATKKNKIFSSLSLIPFLFLMIFMNLVSFIPRLINSQIGEKNIETIIVEKVYPSKGRIYITQMNFELKRTEVNKCDYALESDSGYYFANEICVSAEIYKKFPDKKILIEMSVKKSFFGKSFFGESISLSDLENSKNKSLDLESDHKSKKSEFSSLIPESNPNNKNNSLLIIPALVDYPEKYFWGNDQKFVFQFSQMTTNKIYEFIITPKRGEKFIIISNIEPAIYSFEKIKFPGDDAHEEKTFILGSSPRTRQDLDKSLRADLRNLTFEILDNKATIANFKYVYWKETYQGECCSYYSIIEGISNKEVRTHINELKAFKNFDSWQITKQKKILPEPNLTSELQSLLVIPVSVKYPSNYRDPVKGWVLSSAE